MDKKIYNYKEKRKLSKINEVNKQKPRNQKSKDLIYFKSSAKSNEKKMILKINKNNQPYKLNPTKYKTINQNSYQNLRGTKNQTNNLYLKTDFNNNVNIFKNKSKPKQKLKLALTEPNKLQAFYPNMLSKNKINNVRDKFEENNYGDLPLVPSLSKTQNFVNNKKIYKEDSEINIEYQNLLQIWEETGVIKNYMKNFEIVNLNNINEDNKDEILQIIKAEIIQMTKFKNDIIKTMKLIEKREEEIKTLKNLDKKYSNFNIYLNFEDESDAKNMLDDKVIKANKDEIETEIHKSLTSLRLKGINVVNQIRKIKMKYSNLITIGKIDIDYLNNKYGYDKNYLIKLISDLDFLKDSNIRNLYHFSSKGQDPFLLSLSTKSYKTDLMSSAKSRETPNDFFSDFEENELNSKNDNKDNNNNTLIIDGKKYKTLSITKEIWEIIKKLMYYLSQEILFHMVKLEQEEMNDLSTHQINREHSSLNCTPNLFENNNLNMNVVKNTNKENLINPSRAIANLKSMDKKEYNKLFFNKTLANSKSNNEKRIIKRSEKMNIFLKLNKDIELFEKKLRGDKYIDSDDNDQDLNDIFNILHKNKKNKEQNNMNKDDTVLPKIGSHKDIKKLVIRTNTSDYFKPKEVEEKQEEEEAKKKKTKRPTIIVEEKILAKRKKEELVSSEIERRIKIEIDKKIKSIEDSITNQMKLKMEQNQKRLQKESKLIEEEKKKLEKFLEQQKNLRILEEQKREKLALEHQKELEKKKWI